MIQIYKPGNEDFQHNGDAVLFCYSCDLEVQLNSSWAINLEVPIDDEGRWQLVQEEAVLKVPTWQEDPQLYRIAKVTKTEDGVSAVAYPIFFDSADDCFLMDVRPTGKTGQEALDIMMEGSPYSGRSDITSANTAYFVRRNLMSAINGGETPTFIERWGGEILYDNYKVIINRRVGGDYGMEARYGRNINGTSYVVDTSELVTRIIPIGYNGRMISGDRFPVWVDSPNIDRYAKVYHREVRYENIRMKEDVGSSSDDSLIICDSQAELDDALRAAAEADFASGIDAPKVTIDIDMAVIRSMASVYQDTLLDEGGQTIKDGSNADILTVWMRDYSSLETVRLGDTVRCRHYKLDITSTARVIAMTWDCVRQCVTHVTLGDYQYDYIKTISGMVNRIGRAIRDDGTLIAERIQGYINGATTQLRTQYNLAEKQDVLAILFENLDETSPMYGALGIGTQGISVSKTRTADGRDWDWTTGITANGMNADIGIFGIISDKLGRNWWDMDKGEFHMSSESTIGGKTIDDYMDEAGVALADYARTTDATIAQIQAQIDGQYETFFEDYEPTLSNYPASEWTTEAIRAEHEGDLFYDKDSGNSYRFFKNEDTGLWEWTLITDTVAAQALQAASRAQDTADGKRRVFTDTPRPPYDAGDVYFTGQEIKVCVTAKAKGGTYAAADFVRMDTYNTASSFGEFLAQYQQTIDGIRSDVDDRIETWPQDTDPFAGWTEEQKAGHEGDIWYNTSSGVMKYWTGSAWADMTTSPPASVVRSINAKATVFTARPVPPYRVGDLWFDSATADIMTCISGRETGAFAAGDWQKRNKYTDDSALDSYKQELAGVMDDLQAQVDGKIQTYYQASDPAASWTDLREGDLLDSSGAPVVDEDSEEISTPYEYGKAIHKGDLWYNTSDNTQWRWNGGGWEPVTISDMLMDTIDGKKTIYSAQPVPPYAQCDLWVQGETGDILVCVTPREAGEAFNASDWHLASKYTDDSALNAWIDGDYAETIQELRDQADGKSETWYQAADPSAAWKTADEMALHQGDLWYRTTDQTTWFWSGTAWREQNVPLDVFDKIDTKAQVFAVQPVPPYHEKDLWFTGTEIKVCVNSRASGNYTASDWVKRDAYTDDSALTAWIAGEYKDDLEEISASIDGKMETWYQQDDPAASWTEAEKAAHNGDIWYSTDEGKTYRYSGSGWAELTSTPPAAVFDRIDGKARIFTTQPVPPYSKNDLWYTGNEVKVCIKSRTSGSYVASEWAKKDSYTDDSALTAWIAGDYANTVQELRDQADGKAETWYQSDDPAAEWTSTAEKAKHKGDLWYDTSTQKTYYYTGTKWEHQDVPTAVFDKIDTKAQVFAVKPAPPYHEGDLYYTGKVVMVCVQTRLTGSYTASDWARKDGYTDDSALTAWIAGDYAETIQELQNQDDQRAEIWVQSSDPATSWTTATEKAKHKGDIWYNGTTYQMYSGTKWEEMKVAPPASVMSTINGKSSIYTGPTEPASPEEGDLWFKGAGEGIQTYVGGAWTIYNKYTDDSGLATFISGTYTPKISNLQTQLDGKIETWFYAYVPVSSKLPESAWTTDAERAKHVGDLFYCTKSGSEGAYRYASETSGYKWVKIADASVTQALSDASKAKATADKKMQVFTAQPVPPYGTGDIWISGDEVKYCTTARSSGSFVADDWAKTPTEQKVTTTLEALNGEIIAKVVAGDIINAINLSQEGVSIDASMININGVVSANQYFKINADGSFETIKGDIGNIHIFTNGIYSGSHSAYNSSSPGFYFSSNGRVSIGDANTYIRYSGSGELVIKAKSVSVSGTSVATTAVTDAIRQIAEQGVSDAATAQGAADTAQGTADAAQSAAQSAAGTATNFLYYDETTGLVVSQVGTAEGSSAKPYNVRILGDGIAFRTGARDLAKISGAAFTIYRPTGTAGLRVMELTGDGLIFYNAAGTAEPGSEKVAAKYTANGLEVAVGRIAGFKIASTTIGVGTLGNASAKSVFMSSGTSTKAAIGGSAEISGWVFTSRDTFGVNADGKVYISSGKIGGLTIAAGAIYSGEKSSGTSSNTGFYLGSDGVVNIGNASNYIKWTDGEMKIRAKTVVIGATGVDVGSELNTVKTTADGAKTAADGATSAVGTMREEVDQMSIDLDVIDGTASEAQATAGEAKSTATAAQGVATAAQSAAAAASTAAGEAKTAAANAAKTATNYLHVTSSGLIINNNESNTNSGSSVLVSSTAIQFRAGSVVRSEITASGYTIYRTVDNERKAAIQITNTAIKLNRPDGTAGVTINSNGISITSGSVAGMTVSSDRMEFTYTDTVDGAEVKKTAYFGKRSRIAFCVWTSAEGDVFKVDYDGKMTATKAVIKGTVTATGGKIGTWNIDSNGIYNGHTHIWPTGVRIGSFSLATSETNELAVMGQTDTFHPYNFIYNGTTGYYGKIYLNLSTFYHSSRPAYFLGMLDNNQVVVVPNNVV